MSDDQTDQKGAATRPIKTCFVVSEFGRDENTRTEREQMLKHLVKKVLKALDYEVRRADDISDPGQITHQIIEHMLDDDLVVADLTGLNPNVFYELAVRHAAGKPVVTLMTTGQEIPFDVKDVRTVFYDLHDPDKLEEAQRNLEKAVRAIEASPGDEVVRNPITVVRNALVLQQSDDPRAQDIGTVLLALNDLRDEIRGLSRRSLASLREDELHALLARGSDLSRKTRPVNFPPNAATKTMELLRERDQAPEEIGASLGIGDRLAEELLWEMARLGFPVAMEPHGRWTIGRWVPVSEARRASRPRPPTKVVVCPRRRARRA